MQIGIFLTLHNQDFLLLGVLFAIRGSFMTSTLLGHIIGVFIEVDTLHYQDIICKMRTWPALVTIYQTVL